MKCPNCGTEISENTSVCPKCGTSVINITDAISSISSADLISMLEEGLSTYTTIENTSEKCIEIEDVNDSKHRTEDPLIVAPDETPGKSSPVSTQEANEAVEAVDMAEETIHKFNLQAKSDEKMDSDSKVEPDENDERADANEKKADEGEDRADEGKKEVKAEAAAPSAAEPKKRSIWPILLAVAAVAIAALFGFMGFQNHQAEEAARTAIHEVKVPISISGLSSGSSRIPIRVTGEDNEGAHIDEVVFVNASGESLKLQKGNYQLSVEGTPISADGTLYSYSPSPIALTIPEDIGTAATYDPDFGTSFSFAPLEAKDVTDSQIVAAIDVLKNDPESQGILNALRSAAQTKRDEALEAERQAAIQAEIDRFTAATAGWQHFEGNLNIMTGREVFARLGMDFDANYGDLADEFNGTYAIVWFDEVQPLVGKSADGSQEVTQDVDHVCVAGVSGEIDQKWRDLDNHRVSLAVTDVYYPDSLQGHASPVARNADAVLLYPNGIPIPEELQNTSSETSD